MDQRTKKRWFGILALIFLGLLLYASYDIATRTTFPGSKPQLKERIEEQFGDEEQVGDTLESGSGSPPDSPPTIESN